jgi:hypothetical protein
MENRKLTREEKDVILLGQWLKTVDSGLATQLTQPLKAKLS